MLSESQIEKIAESYLLKNKLPIVPGSGKVIIPQEAKDTESAEFLYENNIARVSFISIYLNTPEHPEHELDPGVYIVYVDLETGEVNMPRHM